MDKQRDVVIELKLSELKYDVKFDSWLKEKITYQQEKNRNEDADRVGIAYKDDKAEDWLVRQIDNAIGNIESELNWAVCKKEESSLQTDDIFTNPTEWDIHLVFSKDWQGSPRAMKTFAHEYVVGSVLYNWYRAEDMNTAIAYKADAEESLAKMYEMARSERVEGLEPFRL